MKYLEITLKSGAQVQVDVQGWEIKKRDGELSELVWQTPTGAKRKLTWVDLDEIACLVEVQ